MEAPGHPIRVVTRRTGLSPHVLRMWERRYGAVRPSRTRTGRRFYNDADLARLHLLKRATQSGRSIGQIAALSNRQIAALLQEDTTPAPDEFGAPPSSTIERLEACTRAVTLFDAVQLETILQRARVDLDLCRWFDDLVVPFVQHLAVLRQRDEILAVQEQLGCEVVRDILHRLERSAPEAAALVLVAAPPGAGSECGVRVVAALLSALGWRTVSLGCRIRIEEIAAVVRECGASVVVLDGSEAANAADRRDDKPWTLELESLQRELHGKVLVWGHTGEPASGVLARHGIGCGIDTAELGRRLEVLRHEEDRVLAGGRSAGPRTRASRSRTPRRSGIRNQPHAPD